MKLNKDVDWIEVAQFPVQDFGINGDKPLGSTNTKSYSAFSYKMFRYINLWYASICTFQRNSSIQLTN
jgi:hypothetical protein